jgi:hypothetical protein
MKRFVRVTIVVIAGMGWSMSMAQQPLRVRAEFPGASLKWIHIAEPEIQRRKLDLDRYNVSIIEEKDSVIVSLQSLDNPEGAMGSMGSYPGYQVEISKKDLKVVRANYIR